MKLATSQKSWYIVHVAPFPTLHEMAMWEGSERVPLSPNFSKPKLHQNLPEG